MKYIGIILDGIDRIKIIKKEINYAAGIITPGDRVY